MGRAFKGFRDPYALSSLRASGAPPVSYTAPTVALVGTLGEGTTSAVVPIPAGYATDDIGYLVVDSANEVVATPAGWTALTPQGVGTAGAASAVRVSTFWKRLTAAVEVNPTVTAAIDHVGGVILCVRGCPNDAVPVLLEAGGASSVTAGVAFAFESLATPYPNCLVIHAASRPNDSALANYSALANANLTDLTEQFDGGTTQGLGGGLGVFSGVLPMAGSIGSTMVTPANGGNSGRQTVVFRPAFFP